MLAALLCLWATIPVGGASRSATASVVIACFVMGLLAHLLSAAQPPRERPGSASPSADGSPQPGGGLGRPPNAWAWLLACLALWVLFQTLPLPVRLLGFVQPLARRGYQVLFAGRGFAPLAFNRFDVWSAGALWLAYGLLAWACARCLHSRSAMRLFAYGLAGGGFLQALIGIITRGSPSRFTPWAERHRAVGTFSSGNSFGGYLGLTLLMTVGTLLAVVPHLATSRKRGRSLFSELVLHPRHLVPLPLLSLAAVVQAVALLLSGSRGAIVTTAVSLVVLLGWFLTAHQRAIRVQMVRMTILCFALVLLIGTGGTFALVAVRFENLLIEPQTQEFARLSLWQAAGRLWLTHPLGVGPGGFGEAFVRFHPPGFGEARAYQAHNDYLQMLVELGLPGFLLLAALLAAYGRRLAALLFDRPQGYSIWMWRAAALAVFAALGHALVEFNLTSRPGVAVTFFTLLGATLAYRALRPARATRAEVRTMAIPPVMSTAALPGSQASAAPTGPQDAPDALRPFLAPPASPPSDIAGVALTPPPAPAASVAAPRRGRAALAIVLYIFGALLAWREIRCAAASRAAEAGFRALGGRPDRYVWPAPARVPAEQALPLLRRAVRRTPRDLGVRLQLARGLLMDFNNRHAQALQANLARMPDSREEEVRALVQRAMRWDELQALAEADSVLSKAVRLVRWSPDAQASLGHVRLRRHLLQGAPAEVVRREGLAHLAAAVWLAPRDVTTLEHVCAALGTAVGLSTDPALTGELQALLTAWGIEALRQDGVDVAEVLRAWSRAGLPLDPLRSAADVPAKVFWGLYEFCDEQQDGENALLWLEAIVNTGLPEPERPARKQKRKKPLPPSPRERVIRERAKWLLRLGRWPAYRDFAAQRRTAFEARLNRELDYLGDAASGGNLVRLRLQRVVLQTGLDLDRRLALCELELDKGQDLNASQIVADIALTAEEGDVARLHAFLDRCSRLADDDQGRELAVARWNVHDGDPALAAEILGRLTAEGKLPFMYEHKARVRLAGSLLRLDRTQEARDLLERVVAECPQDVHALRLLLAAAGPACPVNSGGSRQRVVDLLGRAVPACGLGLQFLGGGAILQGFDLTAPAAMAGNEPTLRLFWEFSQKVPTELAVSVEAQDPTNRRLFGRRYAFAQTHPVLFGAGSPRLGCPFVMEFRLPAAAYAAGGRLIISLLDDSEGAVLKTDEGLPALELLNWPAHVRTGIGWAIHATGAPAVVLTGVDPAPFEPLRRELLSAMGATAAREPAGTDAPAAEIRLTRADVHPSSGFDLTALGPDGFAVLSGRRTVEVASCGEAGLVYGAHALLRDHLGRLHLLPDSRFEVRESVSAAAASPLWLFEAPAFCWRYLRHASTAADAPFLSWAARNGLSISALAPKPRFSHNLHRIYPPEQFYAQHPNWYPLIGGERRCPTNNDWQVCLSAAGLVERAVTAGREVLSHRPRPPMFSLGINDSDVWCECDACRLLCPAEEQSRPSKQRWWSEPYWQFVNAVAERLAEEFPDARIGALGYGAVSTPPSFKLQTNVVVFVCQDSAGYFDARYRENDARLLELWRAQAAHIGIYGYPGLISWVFPRYCAAELALQLAAARQAGATEFYGEDCWVEWIDADLPWITAQLLWNPWQDVAQLQERFRGAAFGPAAQAMGKYTAELRRLWEGAEQGVWFDGLFDLEQQARRYSEEDLAGLARLATATRRAAAGGSAYADRVEAVTQPMELARALAREIACAHSLRAAAAGAEQAETTARRRAALAEAVAERERLVAGLADRPWGESALRALQAQDTLNRWNRKLAGVAPDLAPPQEP